MSNKMALNEAKITADIRAAFAQVMNDEGDRDAALDKVSQTLAGAIMDAIKAMQITYTTGLTTSMGPVTGTFGFTIT